MGFARHYRYCPFCGVKRSPREGAITDIMKENMAEDARAAESAYYEASLGAVEALRTIKEMYANDKAARSVMIKELVPCVEVDLVDIKLRDDAQAGMIKYGVPAEDLGASRGVEPGDLDGRLAQGCGEPTIPCIDPEHYRGVAAGGPCLTCALHALQAAAERWKGSPSDATDKVMQELKAVAENWKPDVPHQHDMQPVDKSGITTSRVKRCTICQLTSDSEFA